MKRLLKWQLNHLKFYPGKGFFIDNEDREVDYLDTKIDPNRIFSRSGSYRTLKKFKPEWSQVHLA